MTSPCIWVIDDDHAIRWVLEKTLTKANYLCRCFAEPHGLLHALTQSTPAVIITDIRMPDINGLDLLAKIHANHPNLPVIVMTAHSDLDAAVHAYQAGAFEYLPKPFDLDEVLITLEKALNQSKPQSSNLPTITTDLIGEAPSMQAVFRVIGRLSQSSISVLINGESGTGKELIAKALHKHSPRAHQPFIALNMAAIPHDLIESELFGHDKGAFTGANSGRKGRFEQANGGTLFLDEIGDMPLTIQTRLLRVLAEKEFYPVGAKEAVRVDVRIVAATHQNLQQKVSEGVFREDLFHRLNVIRIQLPPLRERTEDIPRLTQHFLHQIAHELQVEEKYLHCTTLSKLKQFPWEGNVRQLENVCRWLTVMASGQEVLPEDLPEDLITYTPKSAELVDWQQGLQAWAKEALNSGKQDLISTAQQALERVLLNAALTHTQGRKQEAAQKLGWGRNTLTRKLKELADDKNGE
jgi:two-component system nitrogen regulation response regulator GlnG